MPLTDIPASFGAGGANLGPESSRPRLGEILDEHKTAIEETQTDIAALQTEVGADDQSVVGNLDVGGDATIDGDLQVNGALLNGSQWFELDAGEIDPTAPAADYTITPPPGYYLIAQAFRTIQTQLDGTLTSAAVSNCGNDAAKLNIAASSANTFGSLAQINTSPTGVKQYSVSLNSLNPAVSNMVSTTTPFTLQITTPAVKNTATVYRVRIFLLGILIPV